MRSVPASPLTLSITASAPDVSAMKSLLTAYRMTSLSAPPAIVSTPPAPVRLSVPMPPLRLSPALPPVSVSAPSPATIVTPTVTPVRVTVALFTPAADRSIVRKSDSAASEVRTMMLAPAAVWRNSSTWVTRASVSAPEAPIEIAPAISRRSVPASPLTLSITASVPDKAAMKSLLAA